MNKIGIVTTYGDLGRNYGAALQAAALCKELDYLGYRGYVLPYIYNVEDAKINRIKYIFDMNFSFKGKVGHFLSRNNRRKLAQVFQEFVVKNIPLFDEFGTLDYVGLQKNTDSFFGFITGSDQVWNPLIHGNQNEPGCFLKFAQKSQKRIAYAPSFGISVLPENIGKGLSQALEGFDAISVREKSGAEIIKKETGLDVPVVLDPTLLLTKEQWNTISEKNISLPEKYILCYKFGKMKGTNEQIRLISKKTGWPVIELPLWPEAFADGFPLRFDIGPAQFIYLVSNASLVMTDSFHATVFSIIYHTPFYTFLRQKPTDEKNMNSRMINLLEKMNLKNRMILSGRKIDLSKLQDLDFSDADTIINQERKTSLDYLKTALEK